MNRDFMEDVIDRVIKKDAAFRQDMAQRAFKGAPPTVERVPDNVFALLFDRQAMANPAWVPALTNPNAHFINENGNYVLAQVLIDRYSRITGVEDVVAYFAEVHEALRLAAQVVASTTPAVNAPGAVQPVPTASIPQQVQPLPTQPGAVLAAPPAPQVTWQERAMI